MLVSLACHFLAADESSSARKVESIREPMRYSGVLAGADKSPGSKLLRCIRVASFLVLDHEE